MQELCFRKILIYSVIFFVFCLLFVVYVVELVVDLDILEDIEIVIIMVDQCQVNLQEVVLLVMVVNSDLMEQVNIIDVIDLNGYVFGL